MARSGHATSPHPSRTTPLHTLIRLKHSTGLVAVITSTFFLGCAYGISYPITSLTFEAWGAPAWLTGVAAAMPPLAALIMLPFAPRLARRYGLVPCMIGGCILGATGFLLMPLWPHVATWLVLRFLMGLGLVFPWLLSESWINSVSTERRRSRILAAYAAALLSGFGIGPIMLQILAHARWAPFLFGAAALVMAAAPLIVARRHAPAQHHTPTTKVSKMLRHMPVIMSAAFLAGVVEHTYIALLPTLALRNGIGEATAVQLVTAFLWGGVALAFLFGWVADTFRRDRVFQLLIVGFSVLAILLAFALSHPVGALTLTFILGGVACAFYNIGLAMLGAHATPAQLTAANAAFLLVYQVGTLVGPPAAGAAMDIAPTAGLTVAIAGIMAGILAFTCLHRPVNANPESRRTAASAARTDKAG